jgi:uncharacterized protein
MNIKKIAALSLRGYSLPINGVHGPAHWLRVLRNGYDIAERTEGADLGVVTLFALLHDCRRLDDGHDIGHGERAAAYVRQLAERDVFDVSEDRIALLATACAGHELGQTSTDPTIGACWDADRLELSRLGRPPIDRYLSTSAARDPTIQAAAWQRGIAGMWDASLAEAVGW